MSVQINFDCCCLPWTLSFVVSVVVFKWWPKLILCVSITVSNAVYLGVSLHINRPSYSSLCLTGSFILKTLLSSLLSTWCVYLHHSPSTTLPRYHPGHRRVAKWSRSSCTTEATAGTAITASLAPAATRSCWMELASSWTSTPLRMTTCWMGMLPPQVGTIGYLLTPHQTVPKSAKCGPLEHTLRGQGLMRPLLSNQILLFFLDFIVSFSSCPVLSVAAPSSKIEFVQPKQLW